VSSRKPGPPLWVALAALGVGLLFAIPAGVVVVARGVRGLNTPSLATPGTTHRHLSAGTWIIFQRTGTRSGAGGFTFSQNGAPDLLPEQVTVTGPGSGSGAPSVPAVPTSANETITQGSRVYTSALQFDVVTAGDYTVAVDAPGQVLITRSLGHTFGSLLVPLLLAGVGGVLALTGVVLLIVGSVRRSHADRVAGPPGGPPTGPAPAWAGPAPGWYPDPGGAGGQRWWDGTGWLGP
jgi:hypothetical protein